MGDSCVYSQRLGEAGRNDRRSMRGAFRRLLPTWWSSACCRCCSGWAPGGCSGPTRARPAGQLRGPARRRAGVARQLEGLRDPAYVRVRLHAASTSGIRCCWITGCATDRPGSRCCNPSTIRPAAFGCWSTAAGSHGLTDARRRRWKPPTASSCSTPGPTCRHPAACTDRRAGRRLAAPGDPARHPGAVAGLRSRRAALEIRLEPGDASFDTDWPLVSMPPGSTGYAVQWFALATALLALYLCLLGVRRARSSMSLAIPMPERPRRAVACSCWRSSAWWWGRCCSPAPCTNGISGFRRGAATAAR